MIPAPTIMSDAVFALTLVLLLLAPLAIAGVALINTGLGRSRSAAQSLLGNLAMVAVTAIVFAVVGAAWAGTAGHTFRWPASPGTGSARVRFCWEALVRLRRNRNSRCSLSFWPWPWRPSFPGARERTAGGSAPAAPPPRCWLQSSFLCWRIGSGAAAGWRSWA